ncbi:hypothetical protein NLS1_15110 [Nocardioides sp. LS1]|nr:hypothetical protein NLS1_15110 [Nocardioides sp. LS1]
MPRVPRERHAGPTPEPDVPGRLPRAAATAREAGDKQAAATAAYCQGVVRANVSARFITNGLAWSNSQGRPNHR